ncbi:AAA family ATPase [Streptomyces griseus]|uniref:AAA family ATPase n=1 Tax=Streptomyces griseus TaxID=1911 RepID=UPI0033ED0F2A
MTTLFLMVGLPGAGKTTRARQLAEEHGALRLTPDEWLLPLFGEAEPDGKRDVLEGRMLWLAARVAGLAGVGRRAVAVVRPAERRVTAALPGRAAAYSTRALRPPHGGRRGGVRTTSDRPREPADPPHRLRLKNRSGGTRPERGAALLRQLARLKSLLVAAAILSTPVRSVRVVTRVLLSLVCAP